MASRKQAASAAAEPVRPASAERGEIALVLDGQSYVLRPSYEAIEAFETATGKGLLELARGAVEGSLRLGETAQVVTECVRAWGRAVGNTGARGANAVTIAGLIIESDGGLVHVSRILGGVLSLAVTGGYTAQGEVKAGTTTTSAVPAAS